MDYEGYLKISPNTTKIHFWNLPDNISVGFNTTPKKIKLRKATITIRKLVEKVGKNKNIEKEISYVGRKRIKIDFPINLDNINYARLYALMLSEGSTDTEFSIHVPEKEFHELFKNSLTKIFGKQMEKFIVCKKQKGILRSRAPQVVRFLLPIYSVIPKVIFQNKKYSREYLRIVFEAEGSPIFVNTKRYISLKRNSDISPFLDGKLHYPVGKRIYLKQLSKDYPYLAQKIKESPDIITLGEKIILKKYFDINTTILPECIRINKTDFRCGGKVSARWDTYIYAINVNKFIEKIGFFGKSKIKKSTKMLKISGNREQFFVFELIKKISKNSIFTTKNFVAEMKELGYKSPRAYIWRYNKSGKINRIERGKYKILDVH